jgi:hypothetical protein
LHAADELDFFTDLIKLEDAVAFQAYLAPLRRIEWVIYAKRPFAGPSQVLAYLAHYTHRVAISNSRILSLSDGKISFRWKDYRQDGKGKVMMLAASEFIRRFLLHVLPDGFHRIRYYGLFANGQRAETIELCRKLLEPPAPAEPVNAEPESLADPTDEARVCPCCGGRMKIIETFDGAYSGRYQTRRFDSS